MTTLAQMQADTTEFLSEWGESLTRYRATVTYDSGRKATENWGAGESVTGDWQPLSGSEIEAEAGLKQQSEAKIIMEYDADVVANDRIERESVNYRVNYVKAYEEHLSVFVYREVDQ